MTFLRSVTMGQFNTQQYIALVYITQSPCCNGTVLLVTVLSHCFWQIQNRSNIVWGHLHVTPSPIQSHFTSQLSFLCPYTNQHTDLANSILTTTGNHSLTPSFSAYSQTKETAPGKTGGTTARPRCLVDQAHHHSSGASSSSPSEPVAAASIPQWTSGQSTAWPAVHHRPRTSIIVFQVIVL